LTAYAILAVRKGPDSANEKPLIRAFLYFEHKQGTRSKMSTPVQAASSQTNALQSTGPRTAAGKAVSRLNALRHGATSKTVVLPGEDPAEFERFEKALLAELRPVSEGERDQAKRVAALSWRLNRMYDMEANVLSTCMDHVSAENFLDAAAMYTEPENEKRLRLFHRYLTSAERAYNKALKDYRELQADNQHRLKQANSMEAGWIAMQREAIAAQHAVSNKPTAAAGATGAAPTSSARLSFVSQNSQTSATGNIATGNKTSAGLTPASQIAAGKSGK
jgi:hypothetical protein